jgi:hypothetical protein
VVRVRVRVRVRLVAVASRSKQKTMFQPAALSVRKVPSDETNRDSRVI